VKIPIRRPLVKKVDLAGPGAYLAVLKYSRMWGTFTDADIRRISVSDPRRAETVPVARLARSAPLSALPDAVVPAISEGWEADGVCMCPSCGRRTPQEAKVRPWWNVVFGDPAKGTMSGCLPFLLVMLLVATGVGILLAFLLWPLLPLLPLALGQALFPRPRRCAVCRTPVTLSERRHAEAGGR
jgi:hypothetical protein